MKKIISAILFGFFSITMFAQIKVLSPVEGIFANKQMLVIENDDGGDYYYSLNGTDPETFGFAYDGPVLIDLDGEVELKIAKAGKNVEDVCINYTVLPDSAFTADYTDFISSFYDTGIINYTSGSTLSIPEQLKYSFGLPPDSFLQGTDLSISQSSVLIRYIPCTVFDEDTGKKWRFIVKTFPQVAGIFSRRDVPFYITDWDTITFTNEKYIYRIDSSMWELPDTSKKLDRSQSHMIYWQSIDYSDGNPVEFFVLPPKPELVKSTDSDGCIHFSLEGDNSYSLGIITSESNNYQELFKDLGIDTFFGDSINGNLKIGFYTDSVYQGEEEVSFAVNKRLPSTPIFQTKNDSFYSRQSVELSIVGEQYSDLYYAISEPFTITDVSETYTKDSPIFEQIQLKPFEKADSNILNLRLSSESEGAVYFKIAAYSQNQENKGKISVYSVIIDQYNFYYNANANPETADGTSLNPYATFEQCMDAINKGRYACLRIKGPLVIPRGENYILSNCVFVNESDASIVFEEGASIILKNSNLELENFMLSTDLNQISSSTKNGLQPCFKLEDSVLDINNCQFAAMFDKNGLAIESSRSSINIFNTIVSLSASSYSSFISGVKTKLNIQNSSINVTGDTCVTFSLNQGNINLKNNSFKIIGQMGRIGELFAVDGEISSNNFKGTLKNSAGSTAVYMDSLCNITNLKNDSYGF